MTSYLRLFSDQQDESFFNNEIQALNHLWSKRVVRKEVWWKMNLIWIHSMRASLLAYGLFRRLFVYKESRTENLMKLNQILVRCLQTHELFGRIPKCQKPVATQQTNFHLFVTQRICLLNIMLSWKYKNCVNGKILWSNVSWLNRADYRISTHRNDWQKRQYV